MRHGSDSKATWPTPRGNGQGTVIRRGSTYTALVTTGRYNTPDGKCHLIRKSKGGFKSKTEALEYISVLKSGKPNEVTFQRLLDAYRAGPYKKLSDSKQTAYDIAAGRWRSIMSWQIKNTTLGDLQEVLNTQVSTYYPARDMQSVLSHLYKIAMADMAVSVNLARLLTLPELVEEEPIPFSEDELRQFWDAYGKGDYIIGYVLLMIYSGMMPGELLQMKTDMIDWSSREIRGCGLKTKKRKEVAIVFPEFMDPVLSELCEHAGRKGNLVAMNKDKFYTEYHAAVIRAGRKRSSAVFLPAHHGHCPCTWQYRTVRHSGGHAPFQADHNTTVYPHDKRRGPHRDQHHDKGKNAASLVKSGE